MLAQVDAKPNEPKSDDRAKSSRLTNSEPKPKNPEPRTQSQEPRAKNPEPRTQSQEPRAKNPEPRTQSQEPRAKNPEPNQEHQEKEPPPCVLLDSLTRSCVLQRRPP